MPATDETNLTAVRHTLLTLENQPPTIDAAGYPADGGLGHPMSSYPSRVNKFAAVANNERIGRAVDCRICWKALAHAMSHRGALLLCS
jgi:hypothetical protein